MQCNESHCPIGNNMDLARSTLAEKKATAAALYKTGAWTMEAIAERLGEPYSVVQRWLSNLPAAGNSKHAKTKQNPKGAGRPKGRDQPSRFMTTARPRLSCSKH